MVTHSTPRASERLRDRGARGRYVGDDRPRASPPTRARRRGRRRRTRCRDGGSRRRCSPAWPRPARARWDRATRAAAAATRRRLVRATSRRCGGTTHATSAPFENMICPRRPRREVLAREVRADRPEVLGRWHRREPERHATGRRVTPGLVPGARLAGDRAEHHAGGGDGRQRVDRDARSGSSCPICHVSAATARFAQLYAPASAARQPEPDVTPRIRPWPAAAMSGSAARSTLRYPLRCTLEHRTPVVLDPGGESGGAADAGDVDDRVERAELLDELGEQAADRVGVGHRDVRRPGLPAGVDDPLRGGGLRCHRSPGRPSTATPGSTVTTNAP